MVSKKHDGAVITDEELESLECPSFKIQYESAQKILNSLTKDKITKLIESLEMELLSYRLFHESDGVINTIFILDVKQKVSPFNLQQLILRVNNPHKFWETRRNKNEVSILKYLKSNTNIAVPKILSHSSDADSSILGCEYILMERLPGIIVDEYINNFKDINDIPEKLIDQMIGYFRTLRYLKPEKMNKMIGCFNEDLSITSVVHDGPNIDPCEKYHDHIDFQLKWSVKEMKKYQSFKDLADRLEKVRVDLETAVNKNPNVNGLNFDDEITIFHGDLNGSNILVNPETNEITGILDWEFCSHNFDHIELDFFKSWTDDDLKKEQLQKRIDKKIESLEWFKQSTGKYLRNYLYELAGTANQFGFYTYSWFKKDEDKDETVRGHIRSHANQLEDLILQFPEYLAYIENFGKIKT